MNILAKRRAYWLTRLMHEQGWTTTSGNKPPKPSWAPLARAAGLEIRAGSQLLTEWSQGSRPRDAGLMSVSAALFVCPAIFHMPTDTPAEVVALLTVPGAPNTLAVILADPTSAGK